MHSAAEWVATIPDKLTVREALPIIDTALADAKQAADEIAARFKGTLPPPPWPMHAELQRAYAALEGGKLLIAQIVELGHGATVRDRTDPQVVRLMNGGQALYREIDVMRERMKGIEPADIPRLVVDAAAKAAATRWGGVAAFAGLLWLLHELGEGID